MSVFQIDCFKYFFLSIGKNVCLNILLYSVDAVCTGNIFWTGGSSTELDLVIANSFKNRILRHFCITRGFDPLLVDKMSSIDMTYYLLRGDYPLTGVNFYSGIQNVILPPEFSFWQEEQVCFFHLCR
jgi:hypothetical protein